jgi:hypothetical protein
MSLNNPIKPLHLLSLRRIAPLIPYLAVGLGLFGAHNAWVAMLGYHLGMFLVLYWERQWYLARNLMKGGHAPLLFIVTLASAAGGLLLYELAPLLGLPQELGASLAQLGFKESGWLAFILYFSAINAWLEELYWRGYLGNPTISLILTDFWFAGYHLLVLAAYVAWPWLVLAFIALASVAWLWRQITRLSQGLLVSTVSHLVADASVILAIYMLAVQ